MAAGTWELHWHPCDLLRQPTWNPDMAYAFGAALAQDCKARGVNILLGPAVNIARAPFCGRELRIYGRRPFLDGNDLPDISRDYKKTE